MIMYIHTEALFARRLIYLRRCSLRRARIQYNVRKIIITSTNAQKVQS